MSKIGCKSPTSEYLCIDCDCEHDSVECGIFQKSAGTIIDVEN